MSETGIQDHVTVPRLLSVKEVAGLLRCSKSHIYNMISKGVLPWGEVAGKKVVWARDVNSYLEGQDPRHGGSASGEGGSRPSGVLEPPASDALSRQRAELRLSRSSSG